MKTYSVSTTKATMSGGVSMQNLPRTPETDALFKADPEAGVEETLRKTCPDCYKELAAQPGGGVACPDGKCGYWFCFERSEE